MTTGNNYTFNDHAADPAAVEQAQQLWDKLEPLTEGSAQWRYLTVTRKLPVDAVRRCTTDLRVLEPPVPHLGTADRAIVSTIRDVNGTEIGFAAEACGIAGEAVKRDGRTLRRFYNLGAARLSGGLFCAVAVAGAEEAVLVEGHLAKCIAAAALFPTSSIYGFGSMAWLGKAVPPEAEILILEDQAPPAGATDLHHDAMEHGADALLLAGKQKVRRAAGPGCGCCKDLDAALVKHGLIGTQVRLEKIIERATLSLDGEARRVARIRKPIKQAEAAAEVIERLELRKRGLASGFRAGVAKYGGAAGEEEGAAPAGAAVEPEDVIPWHAAVDGAELVTAIAAYITAHAVLPVHAPLTCALWVLHSHAHEASYHSPRLVIRSPTKGCGKSTLRRLLRRLATRPYEAIDITGPTLFRPIEQWRPTVFIDEGNEINWADARDLTAVINSGHCRDDPGVPRCVGPEFEVRMFNVWAPLCLALIGFLPSTLTERSITIEMRKRPPGVKVKRLRRRDRDETGPMLARQAARWAADHRITLENAEPEIPAHLGDRPADNWYALLAIADQLGLGKEARAAARTLSPEDDDAEDLGIQLLADIYDIFIKLECPQLTSKVIAGELHRLEGRPWVEYGKMHHPITTNAIARLLKPFKIRPTGTIRTGTDTAKGYLREAFEATWAAYSLPANQPQPSHRHKSSPLRATDDSHPSHPPVDVTDANRLKATETATCDGVTVASAFGAIKRERGADVRGADVRGEPQPQDTAGAGDGAAGQAPGNGGLASTKGAVAGDTGTGGPMGLRVLPSGPIPGEQSSGAGAKDGRPDAVPAETEVDTVIADVATGTRCGYCGTRLNGAASEEIGGKRFHSDACAVEARKKAAVPPAPSALEPAPKKRRGRIKGADTAPNTEGL